MELLSIYLGDRLGLYRALLEGPATPAELSARAGVHERYAREWLEQQAVAGILDVDGEGEAAVFRLPAAQAEVLTDPASLGYSAPFRACSSRPLCRCRHWSAPIDPAAACRGRDSARTRATGRVTSTGRGSSTRLPMPSPRFRPCTTCCRGRMPASPTSACGHGWSTIALARAYPDAIVDGFDLDEPAIEAAREHAAGIENVTFSELRGEQLAEQGEERYDAGFIFEALHDMPDPVGVLSSLRRALRPDGIVVVMDEAVAETFAAPGDEVERAMYGYSLLICLPDSMSTPGSIGDRHRDAARDARALCARGRVQRRLGAADRGIRGVPVLPARAVSRRAARAI